MTCAPLTAGRLHPSLSAFNFTYWALFCCLLSAVLFMACEYGVVHHEWVICAVIFSVTGVYLGYENRVIREVGNKLRGTQRKFI